MRSLLWRLLSSPVRHPGRWAGLLLLAAVLAVSGRLADGYWKVRRHRLATEEALAHYDFDTAREHLSALLELRPRDAELRLLAAQTARRAGLLDEAEEHLNAYRELPSQSTAESTLEGALQMAQRGELPRVRTYLQGLLDVHHPASNRIMEALAAGAAQCYRLDEAFDWLELLLEQEPGNVPALLKRGQMFASVGKTDAALENYRKAVECEPEHYKARLRLAETLLGQKEAEEAAGHFERLNQRYLGRAAVLLGLARCRLQQGHRDEAVRLLDELLAGHPDDGAALFERGRLDLNAGRLAAAEERLRRAAALLPADNEVNYQMALCLQGREKHDEAEAYLRKMKQIEADLKRLKEEVYPLAFKNRSDPAPRVEAALICMRNDQEQEGLRWLYGALQIDPNYRPAHDALADYYERHGDAERARAYRSKGSNPFPGERRR
jgi:tetratricopeptide (TPR) repeat protein